MSIWNRLLGRRESAPRAPNARPTLTPTTLDRATAESAAGRLLSAVGLPERPNQWAADPKQGFELVLAALADTDLQRGDLVDPALARAMTEGRQRTWPDGGPSKLAGGAWRAASDAARVVARNERWIRAQTEFVDGLGSQRFVPDSRESRMSRVPEFALNTMIWAVDWATWPELSADRDPTWAHYAEPIAELHAAGVERLWVLGSRVVLVPGLLP